MFDFADKVLLLTGANGGIGRAIAKEFFDSGACLVLGDTSEVELRSFARSLDPTGKRVAAEPMDASDPSDVGKIVAVAEQRFGRIDFVVPAAGIYPGHMVSSIGNQEWRQVMAVNTDAVFYLVRSALRIMRDNGAIVTIASVGAHTGVRGHSHYAASKGAILAFTRSIALELAPRIRVNAVSPGIIETPMTKMLLEQRGIELRNATPLQRFGSPNEVASVVAFLCSEKASFVHGEVIHVNGGFFMGA